MLDDMLTVPEAAALLGVSPASVRQLIQRGRLTPVRRVGQLNLLARSDVLAYQAEHGSQRKRGPAPGVPRPPRRERADQGEAQAA